MNPTSTNQLGFHSAPGTWRVNWYDTKEPSTKAGCAMSIWFSRMMRSARRGSYTASPGGATSTSPSHRCTNSYPQVALGVRCSAAHSSLTMPFAHVCRTDG